MRALLSLCMWPLLLPLLLSLEIQSRTVTLHYPLHRHGLCLPRTSRVPKSFLTFIIPTAPHLFVAIDNRITKGDRYIILRTIETPPRLSVLTLHQNSYRLKKASVWHRGSRGRRHANSGDRRGHSQLMRVGCVLGTCQVQILSHRLYQLIGQNGREDSSPMNPRSPHSYG
ncbi:uncharacterized protein adm2b [Thalassophryne amazonica]|uniref:uncharacterized protein adm2b n=1 Tax=Thalassophryne amazonica TaxID=390379 RepID=UPI0014717583|nr:uncharacterized protein adm2b [Thalassophryne amazonica]